MMAFTLMYLHMTYVHVNAPIIAPCTHTTSVGCRVKRPGVTDLLCTTFCSDGVGPAMCLTHPMVTCYPA